MNHLSAVNRNPIATTLTVSTGIAMHALKALRFILCPLIVVAFSLVALPDARADEPASKLVDGSYVGVLASGVFPRNHSTLDNGYGGTGLIGYRSNWYAIEIAPTYADLSQAKIRGATVNGLLFPFSSFQYVYALGGVGGIQYVDYKLPTADKTQFSTAVAQAGLGALIPLQIGRYDFAIRGEGLYRFGRRQGSYNDADIDIDAPRAFRQAVVNIGLVLPIGLRPAPPPPAAAEPVAIAAAPPTPPPACSDGKDNDGDGLIDFPADKGCTSADDDDETDPCKPSAAGERISLKGCGTGDVIILRGVNFEFNKATLTVNAKTILDGVADELTAHPQINVELGGHTDARGSDAYNQHLSERRAEAVTAYLASKGIAASRMTAVGYGESQPIADNDTDEGRELNRRVQLKITSDAANAGGATATGDAAAIPPAADAGTPGAAASILQ